jgi:hypothetical protein
MRHTQGRLEPTPNEHKRWGKHYMSTLAALERLQAPCATERGAARESYRDEQSKKPGRGEFGRAWYGNASRDETLVLAKTGIDPKVTTFAVNDARVGHGHRATNVHDVVGGSLDVGVLMAGAPEHFVRRTKRPSPLMVSILVSCSCNCNIPGPTLRERGLRLLTAIRSIEEAGARVQLDVSFCSAGYNGTYCWEVIRVKDFGGFADPQEVAFWIGHPGAYRHLGFGLWSRDILEEFDEVYLHGLGHAQDPPTEQLAAWDLYLPTLRHAGELETAETLAEEALAAARDRAVQVQA